MNPSGRLPIALAAIDDANAGDPTTVTVRGRTGPKEILHAELVTEWVQRMRPEAADALLLAARGHHLRRWEIPRSTYPAGRAGYLRWRRALHDRHAETLGALLAGAGYDTETIRRAQALVRKESLGREPVDPDVQALEDALCLVFLETQLAGVAARLDRETLERVITKTYRKMSEQGQSLIASLPLLPADRRVLEEAIAADVVRRYLDALPSGDPSAVAATLAPNIRRIGPYGDVYDGRDAYGAFLSTTIAALGGYALTVYRLAASGSTVAVELNETVDDGDARLSTDEAVMFDVENGLIARVAVYLRASERVGSTTGN